MQVRHFYYKNSRFHQ